MEIDGKEIILSGGVIKTAKLADEWYGQVGDPEAMAAGLKKGRLKADIFTFRGNRQETPPLPYYHEQESIAVLPVTTYDVWWKNQVNPKTRNLIRKAEKTGVVVKEAAFDRDFIQGMTEIFNETPVRQGKRFWHYGKNSETIKREFGRYLSREDLIGAYYNGELIGFIFLGYADGFAMLRQIISKIKHRDKAPNNALIAKAVELCEKKNVRSLVYALWTTGSLGDFKRHNGFQKVDLPRYYLPLSLKGKWVLACRLHHGIVGALPDGLKDRLRELRNKWYSTKGRTMPTRTDS